MPETPDKVSHRMMRYEWFRDEQKARLHEPHISPITRLVDELRQQGRGWVPYVAPMHGGVSSRLLTVLRDPGPGTLDGSGSGMLCVENDDPAAENQANMMDAAGIHPSDVLPWNAYPWYINRHPRVSEIKAGLEALFGVLDMLPDLEIVLLQGASAQDSWRRAVIARPDLLTRGLTVVSSFHPARQALFHRDPEVREARRADRIEKMRLVGELLAKRTYA
ncbi:hypothetical protein HDC94_000975 [Leifsonia sp. AK011]|uniref:uracil-DNA glycosylase n=1 Tax=Leifsonia sp. AK011 TaxID=2723075 RepID=UPI0018137EC0|nr:uracil-DNA glycosylase [Leifsonia sp. AK011]NYF09819.1 hypothetical protein [Leifsonia sp. AK011]